jgi:uncharacterized protein
MDYVGRTYEINEIRHLEKSKRSEFLVIYGRRRIGKTQLVRSLYHKVFSFYVTGLANVNMKEQLKNFHSALKEYGLQKKSTPPDTWFEAFQMLRSLIERSRKTRKIIFIDELPWFDTQNSGFLSAFEHFWNSWASGRKDIFLIGCGSAASWMLNNLIRNKGGLHNRVTAQIKIEPFTLAECELFSRSRKLNLSSYQILQLYMVIGGVPFYWEQIKKGQSATQAIQQMCFSAQAPLKSEFQIVFHSLFSKADRHLQIVKALSTKLQGLTRNEISTKSRITNGGGLTRLLDELEESGFVKKHIPYGKKNRDTFYQLSDYFCLFYIKFMMNGGTKGNNHWLKMQDSPSYRAWCGLAFERVCLDHLPNIKKELGISGVLTESSSWRSKTEPKAQIDLLIDRNDHVITLCEMKYSSNPYIVTKREADALRKRLAVFKTETKTNKAVFIALISPYGTAKTNKYEDLIQHNLSAKELFM